MKKYKLKELINVKRGMSLSGEYYATEGNLIRLTLGNFQEEGGFKINTSKDDLYFTGPVREEFILSEGDIITPLTEQVVGLLGSTARIPESGKYIQSGDVALIKCISDEIDDRYCYYLISSDLVRHQLSVAAQQTKIRHTSPEKIMDCEVFIPEVKEQRKIANLLDAINKKIELNNRINDNLQQQLCLVYEHMMHDAEANSASGRFITASELTDIITGKEDANFSTPDGRYKFFTCSNDTLKCNEYVFDTSAILIAGNGDFNVKHYTGKFNAYQRTYVLRPNNKYYGLLYLASLYQINSFKSASTGSIVKFITKSDIENIPVFLPNDDSLCLRLNHLIALQEHNSNENERLISVRDWLLPMLMNGQAIIAD